LSIWVQIILDKMTSIQQFCSQFNANSVLLFDLDGTLVETNEANNLAYLMAINEIMGLNFGVNSIFRITREKLSCLLPQASKEELNKIILLKEKYFSKFLNYTRVNVELFEVLKRFKAQNRLILITRSKRERALAVLKHHGLLDYFQSTICQCQDSSLEWKSKIPELLENEYYNLQDLFLFENEEAERLDALKNGLKSNQVIIVNA
jgi:phosphoglycolate phosphatase-like HAD superfamily hydrolase